MALLLIDQNKKRATSIRECLSGTPIGLHIESFLHVEDAARWANQNTTDLVVVDQHYLEDSHQLYTVKSLANNLPILVLRNRTDGVDENLDGHVHDFLGPTIDRDTLLLRITNLLKLQKAVPVDHLKRYELAISGSHDGVWDWDVLKDTIYFSSRWCEILGYHEGELEPIPSSWLARVHPEDVAILDTALQTHISGATDRLAIEYRLRHKNGHYRWVLTRGQVVFGENGQVCRVVGSQTDITDRKHSEQLMAFNALHDPLTGLANRALLMERLQQIMIHQRRDPSQLYAVLFLDLDKFKEINDNLGHEAGDVILKTVVQRLNVCVRQVDTLARFGGDEFVILVAGTDSEEAVVGLAKRILAEMEKPIKVHEHDICVGISIGVVTDTKDYDDAESSVRDADLALYHAKTQGRNRFEMFNPSMRMNTSKHFNLQATLSGAKDRGELLLHYQPILCLQTGEVKGFEALMRWQHPDNGFIYPLDFIPLAEETGLINQIGTWGIREACRQLKVWDETITGAKDWFMCVNVSGRQLESDSFTQETKQSITDSGVKPGNLIIEITENILMHDIINVLPRLQQLKELGVQLAIDDFGTGYSSLAVLHDFPFDILKIAREFVSDVDTRQKADRTVKLIHLLARETGMKTIVEGIETDAELKVVQRIGCGLGQGYLFSKPKDAETITGMMSAGGQLLVINKKTA